MLKISKQTLIAAVVIAAASAPSNAFARVDLEPSQAPARSAAVHTTQTPAGQALGVPSGRSLSGAFESTPGGLAGPIAHPQSAARHAAASSSSTFQWDDAGIGAAGMLALLGAAGASSVLARRRRKHETPAI